MKTIVNIALMQVSWFACVLGAANELPSLGVGVALVVAALHLITAENRSTEAKLLGVSVLIGFAFDSILAAGGAISFISGVIVSGLTTPWMLGLWLGFATTLNSSLRWLLARPVFAILFGAAGGPLAYWSGAKLGAITLGPTVPSLAAIGICWAAAMAGFAMLVPRISRVSERDGARA